jgi:hypothetical protein
VALTSQTEGGGDVGSNIKVRTVATLVRSNLEHSRGLNCTAFAFDCVFVWEEGVETWIPFFT